MAATRKIGQDSVTELGFGALSLSAFYGEVPSDEDRVKLMDAVFEKGCTFWDTADIYGESEELIGKWFKRSGKRDQVFLATKFGVCFHPENHTPYANNTPEYMRSCLEKSLMLLGTDRIDLYYAHRVDKDTPIEKTVRSMAELVKEGKVRYLGLSEVSAQTLRRAHAVHPIAAVQVEYSPFSLDIERNGLFQACRELGVAVVAYSPLGRGILTGAYKAPSEFAADDFRRNIPKFTEQNFPKLLEVVDELKEIGKKHRATSGQITLAWLLAQGPQVIPIPGTNKLKYLEENLRAADVKLDQEEIAQIRNLVEKANTGEHARYPASFDLYSFVNTVEEK